jgi:hypothetical protein
MAATQASKDSSDARVNTGILPSFSMDWTWITYRIDREDRAACRDGAMLIRGAAYFCLILQRNPDIHWIKSFDPRDRYRRLERTTL